MAERIDKAIAALARKQHGYVKRSRLLKPRLKTDAAPRRFVMDARLTCTFHLGALGELLARHPRHPATERLTPFIDARGGPTRSEELDGWEFHSDRGSFESNRDRDAELLVAGYPTVRITWERLEAAPAREAARLHAILRRRAP